MTVFSNTKAGIIIERPEGVKRIAIDRTAQQVTITYDADKTSA